MDAGPSTPVALLVVMVVLCVWEVLGILIGPVPTISTVMRYMPRWIAWGVWIGVVVYLTDHFFLRHWS